jgi:hypothetical protein
MNTIPCHAELVSASIFVTYWQTVRWILRCAQNDDSRVHFQFNGCVAAVIASE